MTAAKRKSKSKAPPAKPYLNTPPVLDLKDGMLWLAGFLAGRVTACPTADVRLVAPLHGIHPTVVFDTPSAAEREIASASTVLSRFAVVEHQTLN